MRFGQLLSANKIILGSLDKTGSIFIITTKVIDVNTGRIETTVSEKFKDEEDLELAAEVVAIMLGNNIASTKYPIPLKTYYFDDRRNRFSISLSPQIGILPNSQISVVNSTYFDTPAPDQELQSLAASSAQLEYINYSLILSAGYEITNTYGIRIDLRYMMGNELQNDSYSAYSITSRILRTFSK